MATTSKLYNRTGGEYEVVDSGLRSSFSNYSTASGMINTIFPVGSIYMSVKNVSPQSFLSGTTWAALGDRFLLNTSGSYSAGSTGGSATRSLAVGNLPSHNHGFTGSTVTSGNQNQSHTHSGTTGNQSRSHTHTGTSGGASANHYHSGPAHSHPYRQVTYSRDYPGVLTTSGSTSLNTGNGGAGTSGTVSAWHKHTTTTSSTSGNHTHGITTGAQTQGHTHTWTASGTIGNNGSGTAFSIMPPYLVVYMWKRTA